MMVLVQAVQLVASLLLPPLAALLAIATIFWALWASRTSSPSCTASRIRSIVLGAWS